MKRVVHVGANLVESVISPGEAPKPWRSKKDDSVTVVIKSTEVMLQKA